MLFVSFILQVVDSNIGVDIFILILTYKVTSRKSCVVFENLVPPIFFTPNLDFNFGVDIDIGELVVEKEMKEDQMHWSIGLDINHLVSQRTVD